MSLNSIQVERIVEQASIQVERHLAEHSEAIIEAAKIEARGRIAAALIRKGTSPEWAGRQAREVVDDA